jgi:hypothetical protein
MKLDDPPAEVRTALQVVDIFVRGIAGSRWRRP